MFENLDEITCKENVNGHKHIYNFMDFIKL